MSDLRINESSGVASEDEAALAAVRAARFDPLPVGAPDAVDIQFIFVTGVYNKAEYDVQVQYPRRLEYRSVGEF